MRYLKSRDIAAGSHHPMKASARRWERVTKATFSAASLSSEVILGVNSMRRSTILVDCRRI